MNIIIDSLIRPYRFNYRIVDLGRKNSELYEREDNFIINSRKEKIHYSYYRATQSKGTFTDICLVYAHCNSGCRIQGAQFSQKVIQMGWNFCIFDFAGSGISEGDIVTLGKNESEDLNDIVTMLIKVKKNKNILLWGRSMGASTILFYLGKYQLYQNCIKACALDSPYSDLYQLSKQIAVLKTSLPEFIIDKVLQYVSSVISKKHTFDITNMKPIKMVTNIKIPMMYITSQNDQFVSSKHVVKLYQHSLSCCDKRIEYIDKGHNSCRDNETINTILEFFKNSIKDSIIEDSCKLKRQKIVGMGCAIKREKKSEHTLKKSIIPLANYKRNSFVSSCQNINKDTFRRFKSFADLQINSSQLTMKIHPTKQQAKKKQSHPQTKIKLSLGREHQIKRIMNKQILNSYSVDDFNKKKPTKIKSRLVANRKSESTALTSSLTEQLITYKSKIGFKKSKLNSMEENAFNLVQYEEPKKQNIITIKQLQKNIDQLQHSDIYRQIKINIPKHKHARSLLTEISLRNTKSSNGQYSQTQLTEQTQTLPALQLEKYFQKRVENNEIPNQQDDIIRLAKNPTPLKSKFYLQDSQSQKKIININISLNHAKNLKRIGEENHDPNLQITNHHDNGVKLAYNPYKKIVQKQNQKNKKSYLNQQYGQVLDTMLLDKLKKIKTIKLQKRS